MRHVSRFILLAAGGSLLFLTGCQTGRVAGGGSISCDSLSAARSVGRAALKVSLSKQNVYVMEGDRCLMAAAISVGIPAKPTPKGEFSRFTQSRNKSVSGSYGFSVQGNHVVPSTGGGPGRYVGYPMGILVRIRTGLRISSRLLFIRTRARMAVSDCMARLRRNFFALVKIGTPVSIASSQPEDCNPCFDSAARG